MENLFEGKSVAIVGNGKSLYNYTYGKEIDKHDVVVRIGTCVPMTSKEKRRKMNLMCGTKTDVWAFELADDMKEVLETYYEESIILFQMNPYYKNRTTFSFPFESFEKRSIDDLRKRLNEYKDSIKAVYTNKKLEQAEYDTKFRYIKKHVPHLLGGIQKQDNIVRGFSDYESLIDYHPSCDLCVLDLVSKSRPKKVDVYGFDWRESSNTNKDITTNLLLEKSFSQKFYGSDCGFIFKETKQK
jgi:hypothetical protein